MEDIKPEGVRCIDKSVCTDTMSAPLELSESKPDVADDEHWSGVTWRLAFAIIVGAPSPMLQTTSRTDNTHRHSSDKPMLTR